MDREPSVHLCSFNWEINNPFLPWRSLEAAFFHGSPTVTKWRATLRPTLETLNSRKISLSLRFDGGFDHRYLIVAENILVVMHMDGTLIRREDVPNFLFNRGNRFTYSLEAYADLPPQKTPHQLVVKIEISLRGRDERNESVNGLFDQDEDLKELSRNLQRLLTESKHPNMNLLPKNCREPIKAHSYIMNARWNNFFSIHAFKVKTLDTVETNISRDLLWDILTYMYSGTFNTARPDRVSPSYTAELFRVIDRYKLYHLYQVFAKNDMKQVRVTTNSALVESCLVQLHRIEGCLVSDGSHTRRLHPTPEYDFVLQISVEEQGRDSYLSYSLKSESPSRVYAELSLTLVRRRQGSTTQEVVHFYERIFSIDPGSTVRCRNIHIRTFGDSNSTDASEFRYFVRCLLSLCDGTSVDQVLSLDDDALQKRSERYRVLSDHMHTLRREKVDTDMHIVSRSFGPEVRDEFSRADRIHKGIFAIRVPEFEKGIERAPEGNQFPDVARATLSCWTLPSVLDYMHTGKLFTIPIARLEEIKDFAERTKFDSLFALIQRIRLCYKS